MSGCTAGILRPNELQALKRLHRNDLLAGLKEGAKARMESLARASKRPSLNVQSRSLERWASPQWGSRSSGTWHIEELEELQREGRGTAERQLPSPS